MDKTFEEIINEELIESNIIDQEGNLTSENDESTDIDNTGSQTDNQDVDTEVGGSEVGAEDNNNNTQLEENNETVDDNYLPSNNEKDNNAFAEMRVQNKKYKAIVDYFDAQAKNMGYENVDALINKINEAELVKEANAKGIDPELYRKLNELETKVSDFEAREQAQKEKALEERLGIIMGNFVETNKLSQQQVKTLGDNLNRDGVSLDILKNASPALVNRILNSYLPKESIIQKSLEQKEQLKKEAPLNTNSSKTSTTATDDAIDSIAKMWANI